MLLAAVSLSDELVLIGGLVDLLNLVSDFLFELLEFLVLFPIEFLGELLELLFDFFGLGLGAVLALFDFEGRFEFRVGELHLDLLAFVRAFRV